MSILIISFFFLNRLYCAGAHPLISKLYRSVSYPVGRGTPMINSKIVWDHSTKFFFPKFGQGCMIFHLKFIFDSNFII